jgi:N-acetylmuramoyl-L-alanine amidase
MPEHTVRDGDCIASIAEQYGIFWQTVWDHPNNASLKQLRKDPNILKSGDTVFVPDLREKWETCATEQRHCFVRKGVPAKLRLRLMREPESEQRRQPPQATQYPHPKDLSAQDPQSQEQAREDEPRANVPYIIRIDGSISQGSTDSQGKLEISIPPGATSGQLIVEPGTPQETNIPIHLGHLDPIDTVSGVKQRLANLTFDCGDTSDDETETYAEAIRAFQRKYGLDGTGEMDEQTRQKLQDVHGD